jgi:amino acid permease
MPRAMSQMGMLLGTIVIIWSGITSAFGLYLQTRCAQYTEPGHASFFALSQMTYPNLAIIFDAAIAVKCFGVGISYLIIIGDLMPGVVLGFNSGAGDVGYLVDRHFWITAFMFVVFSIFNASTNLLQARSYTPFISQKVGLSQIHQCCSFSGHWLPSHISSFPLHQRRYSPR